MSELPLVTVLVPARNEERDIEDCLSAIVQQDYPRDLLEVLVVDGASTDGTAERAEKVLDETTVTHKVLLNPEGTTPSNLNMGLAAAHGEILCRVDARSLVPPGYVRRCVEVLESQPDVVVVGGAQVAVASDGEETSLGIARALNNRWGMGLSRYRRGAASGPADTVYLGAFRTEELRAAGGWDERFTTNQDFELNRRISQLGIVWFESSLVVGYRPRSSLADLARQYRRFGSWKTRYWRETGDRPQTRQLALLAVPPVALAAGATVALLPSGWRRLAVAAVAAGAVLFESKGPTGPPAPLGAHAVSLAASAAVGAGWTIGAWEGLARSAAPVPATG